MELQLRRPVNFQALIAEIGWGRIRIAAALKVPDTTVQGWANGARPRHEHGEALLALWAHVTRKALGMAPRG